MNDSKSPLNNLALYCDRGLGFLCFWGLGGRFGGLREGNMITEQVELSHTIKRNVCKVTAKQQRIAKGEINTLLIKQRLSIKFNCNTMIKEWRTPPLKMHYLWINTDILYEYPFYSFTIHIYSKQGTTAMAISCHCHVWNVHPTLELVLPAAAGHGALEAPQAEKLLPARAASNSNWYHSAHSQDASKPNSAFSTWASNTTQL